MALPKSRGSPLPTSTIQCNGNHGLHLPGHEGPRTLCTADKCHVLSPFLRKELCTCHNLSNSELPGLLLMCDINSSPPTRPLRSCLTKYSAPKSPHFPGKFSWEKAFECLCFIFSLVKKTISPKEVLYMAQLGILRFACSSALPVSKLTNNALDSVSPKLLESQVVLDGSWLD